MSSFLSGGEIKPEDCVYNFVVPSQPILSKEFSKYKFNAMKPGVLSDALDVFADAVQDQPCKLSIDGKKICVGLDREFGDEDLAGYEDPPSLADRRIRHAMESASVREVQDLCKENMDQNVFSLSPGQTETMSNKLLSLISCVSMRIQELQQLKVKTDLSVQNVLKKVNGPWMEHKLCNVVSFYKTRSLELQKCVDCLLDHVDMLGLYSATLNGNSEC